MILSVVATLWDMNFCFSLFPVCAVGSHPSLSLTYSLPLGAQTLGSFPPAASIASVSLSAMSSAGAGLSAGNQGSTVTVASTHHPIFSQLLDPNWTPPGTSGALSLSISLRPLPARLVQQIQSGRFVEMRDLLRDNAGVRSHFEELQGGLGVHLLPVSSRPRVREVTTLPSWVCCFLTYLAVQTSDQVTRDRATYGLLIVREAMRHGGQGWLDYDRLFRQQAALNPIMQWNTVHPELQATTILSQRTSAGLFCTLCQECDHNSQQCAMSQLQSPVVRAAPVSSRQSGRSMGRICSSWNDGACIYPRSCSFRHICSNCFNASHRAKDCRASLRPKPSSGGSQPGTQPPRPSQGPPQAQ